MSGRPVIVLEALSVRAEPTGVAGAAADLVAALAARDRGIDFTVVASSGGAFPGLAGNPNWRVVTGPQGGGNLRRTWYIQRGLPDICRTVRADLLHSLQLVAPARPGCPLVVTVHDLAWRALPDVVQRPRRLYYDVAVPPGLRRADLLLASSEATARHLAAAFPDVASRIRVTPLGTPLWVLAPPVGPGSEAPDRPFFLFVGALEPRKNLPRLLDAYELLLSALGDRAPDLVLAGPAGWKTEPVHERLARPALRGRVSVRGYCDRVALRRLYEAALALVFPSLLEGFGLPILEAMACGLPVLTSAGGATAEVAGDAALLVDPRDTAALALALGRLVSEPGLCERLRAAGPERALFWSWMRTADLTTKAYEEILRSRGRRK